MIGAPGGVMPGPESDGDDGSVGVPGDGADFGFDAVLLGGALAEGQRERLDERLDGFVLGPVGHPVVEGADRRVAGQQSRHLRFVLAEKLDQTLRADERGEKFVYFLSRMSKKERETVFDLASLRCDARVNVVRSPHTR